MTVKRANPITADQRLALVRLKIERADKHIADVRAALSSFLNANPYKVATKRDSQTRKLIYYIASVEPIPMAIAATAGDCLHCLRDALDHLAQQLYLVGTGDTKGFRNQTSFLITRTAETFNTALANKTAGMREDAIAAIRALEPYPEGKGADLWIIHRLNNIDKHRLIITVGSAFRSLNIGPIMGALFEKTAGRTIPALDAFLRPAGNLFPLSAGDELFVDAPDAFPNDKMQFWPAPGSEDTELGVFMGPEMGHGETKVYTGVQA